VIDKSDIVDYSHRIFLSSFLLLVGQVGRDIDIG